MARNGFPDDPHDYSDGDPTQYADFGGSGGQAYSEYDGPAYNEPSTGYPRQTGYDQHPVAEPPLPAWHHRPAVLVGLGVLTAALLALLIYAIVSFTNAGSSSTPAVTSSATTATTSSAPATSQPPPPPGSTVQSEAPAPSSSQAPAPTTVTSTATPTTTAPPETTTETSTPSTVTSVTTSVTTVTETTTKPRWPTILRPTPRESPAPAAGG